jgi:hypothetical protein
MEPISIPIIFFLGGITGLVSLVLSLWFTREKELSLGNKAWIFIQTFVLCSVVALLGGILFVTLLTFSHG